MVTHQASPQAMDHTEPQAKARLVTAQVMGTGRWATGMALDHQDLALGVQEQGVNHPDALLRDGVLQAEVPHGNRLQAGLPALDPLATALTLGPQTTLLGTDHHSAMVMALDPQAMVQVPTHGALDQAANPLDVSHNNGVPIMQPQGALHHPNLLKEQVLGVTVPTHGRLTTLQAMPLITHQGTNRGHQAHGRLATLPDMLSLTNMAVDLGRQAIGPLITKQAMQSLTHMAMDLGHQAPGPKRTLQVMPSLTHMAMDLGHQANLRLAPKVAQLGTLPSAEKVMSPPGGLRQLQTPQAAAPAAIRPQSPQELLVTGNSPSKYLPRTTPSST
jgi:hypothetical protein